MTLLQPGYYYVSFEANLLIHKQNAIPHKDNCMMKPKELVLIMQSSAGWLYQERGKSYRSRPDK